MMDIATLGLDLAKSVFQVHGVIIRDVRSSRERCGGLRSSTSSASFLLASSASRLAAARTIGHARSQPSDMTCA